MYSIRSYSVDPAELVFVCEWAYSNEDGAVTGVHTLVQPGEGDEVVPLSEVTEELLISWLTSQMTNTAESFEATIARDKAANDKVASLEVLTFDTEE